MKTSLIQTENIRYNVQEYKGSAVSFFNANPSSILKAYIDIYYQAEVVFPENIDTHSNVHAILLPVDSVEMIFCYNDTSISFNNEKKKSSSVCHILGQHNLQSHCNVEDITKITKTFFVRFKPGGFCRLFGIRQNEIKNSFFNAEDILNSEGRVLEDRINNSNSFIERIKAVESFFITKLISQTDMKSNYENVLAAINLIKKSKGAAKVRETSKRLNIAERTLNWNFSNYIGLSPKEFIELLRFKDTLSSISSKESVDWTELVQGHGYYDQSHLINEFKSVTGLTPYLYIKQMGKTFTKCTNKIFFVEPSDNNSLKQYTGDLIQAEKIAAS